MSLKECLAVAVIAVLATSFAPPVHARHRTRQAVPECQCSASLRFSKPDIGFREGVLTFTPRIDVSVRTRGDTSALDWSLGLDYEGSAAFSSEDVTPPADVPFAGSKHIVGGSCGNNRYMFKGFALDPVPFTGLIPSLVGSGEALDSTVHLMGQFTGCDTDELHRMFRFTMEELGNLKVRGWRSAR